VRLQQRVIPVAFVQKEIWSPTRISPPLKVNAAFASEQKNKQIQAMNFEVSGLSLISALGINLDAYNEKPDDKHIYF
jgi:hypothetical protein